MRVTRSIMLYGPPGCGKTTVGRVLAQRLGLPFVDVDDDWLEKRWKTSVAAVLAKEGDAAFLEKEERTFTEELRNIGVPRVVALTGSNPLRPAGMEKARSVADIVFLDVAPSVIEGRLKHMKVSRIVGMSDSSAASLRAVLQRRASMYERYYTLRVPVEAQDSPEQIVAKVERVLNERGSHFVSTRSAKTEDRFSRVMANGLAEDGGLYLPNSAISFFPGEFERLKLLPYPQLCRRVLEKFNLEISPIELDQHVSDAYWSFSHPEVAPLRAVTEDLFTLELWHGPTASFKDLSLQLLPRLMGREACLVATSGDTGSAALDGFARTGAPVVVLFPENGVSEVQKLQMVAPRENAVPVGVEGADFDFCQALVKKMLLAGKQPGGKGWTSANSINLGRLLPQVVFSVSAYCQLLRRAPVVSQFDMAIPTGNFGNILAAIMARRMGLPLRRVVLASNENNVLADFINTGVYDLRQRKFQPTISPSIDILVSSNVERWLYWLLGSDPAAVARLMADLKSNGWFRVPKTVTAEMRAVAKAGWCTQDECRETMRSVFAKHNVLLDPHTAVAFKVAQQFAESGVPMVVASTAHWGKFPGTVGHAVLGSGFDEKAPLKQQWKQLENAENVLPPSLRNLSATVGKKGRIVLPADEKLIETTIMTRRFEIEAKQKQQ